MKSQKSHPKFFRSSPIYLAEADQAAKVDREAGIIKDVVCIQAGEAKGHGVHCDTDFLKHLTSQGNLSEIGIKSRFGHPNMSGEALGTFIGRFKNFSYIEKEYTQQVIADLHLDASAYKTPNGDLATYLMDLAESDPDAFGMSIVFTDDGIFFKDPEGNVISGIPSEDTETDGKTYIKLKEFMGCDAVDQGAATDGLFSSASLHPEKFAVQVTEFLDNHPQLMQFIQDHPEKIEPFIKVYNQYKMKKEQKNPESKFAQLGKMVANFFRENEAPEQFDIDGTTEDGTAIRVVTESESPAEGDQVLIVNEDESTSPAPAGDHVITDGDLAGNTVTTDADGMITAIQETPAEEEEEEMQEAAEETELAELQNQIQQLTADNARLKAENQKLSKGRKVVAKKKNDAAVVDQDSAADDSMLTLSHGNEAAATRLAEQKARFPHLARLIDGEKAIVN